MFLRAALGGSSAVIVDEFFSVFIRKQNICSGVISQRALVLASGGVSCVRYFLFQLAEHDRVGAA
jgi:hypothetical protein